MNVVDKVCQIRCLLTACVVCICGVLNAVAAPPRIEHFFREPWTTFFQGREETLHIILISDTAIDGRLGWSVSADQRVIQRSEQTVALSSGRPAEGELRLTLPEVKPGIHQPLTLNISLMDSDQTTVTNITKSLVLYHEDVFADREDWLKGLNIHLFDPEETTSEVFDEEKIPYTAIHRPAGFDAMEKGLLIVGEDVDFDDYREFVDLLTATAQRGIPVICLAPSSGTFSMPGTDTADAAVPNSMRFRKRDIITELDKKLDADAWATNGVMVKTSMRIEGERTGVTVAVEDEPEHWLWSEWTLGPKNTRVIIIGFPVIEKWADGPTPRYLFSRILEYVTRERTKK